MCKALHAECQKARRRHDLLVAVGIALLVLLWVGVSYKVDTPEEQASCYLMLYYAIPIMNAVVMPIGMAALASRIWDSETKGETCKLLFTLQSRGSLFAAKAALGMLENLLVCGVEILGVWAVGQWKGTQEPDPGRFAWLFLCTFAVNGMLYFFSFWLSIRFRNQVAALAVGFCGALIGLFAAFMPPVFSFFVPFGYYIPLTSVGMTYDAETRISTYFPVDFRWWLLGVTAALGFAAASLCCRAIQTKEV